VQLETARALADYWATDYDWRAFEERFAALPHSSPRSTASTSTSSTCAEHEDAMPLVVTHGWPGSTVEQLKIIDPLTKPTEHGASAADAFHLVIPHYRATASRASRPRPAGTPFASPGVGRADGALGYDRYVAQGGDWGMPSPSSWPAEAAGGGHPHQYAGDAFARDLEGVQAGEPVPEGLGGREEGVRDPGPLLRDRYRLRREMGNRPQTLRHRGLAGRPGGLDARSRRGQLQADRALSPGIPAVSRDDILDNATHYWLTNSGSSARLYWRASWLFDVKGVEPGRRDRLPDELYPAPQSWAEKAYPKLVHYNRVDEGGHFAAWEQPQTLSEEIRATFRSLR
jgi:hypothetical protein